MSRAFNGPYVVRENVLNADPLDPVATIGVCKEIDASKVDKFLQPNRLTEEFTIEVDFTGTVQSTDTTKYAVVRPMYLSTRNGSVPSRVKAGNTITVGGGEKTMCIIDGSSGLPIFIKVEELVGGVTIDRIILRPIQTP